MRSTLCASARAKGVRFGTYRVFHVLQTSREQAVGPQESCDTFELQYIAKFRVISTSSRYRQNGRHFIKKHVRKHRQCILGTTITSLVGQRPVMIPKSILERLYRFCLRSRPKHVRDIPNLKEILLRNLFKKCKICASLQEKSGGYFQVCFF